MLTQKEIDLQRQWNKEETECNNNPNFIKLPLDDPYELLDIIERAQKALISDSLVLCLECTIQSIDSARYDANGAPVKVDTTYKQPCGGYECKNEAIFHCYFTNKLY